MREEIRNVFVPLLNSEGIVLETRVWSWEVVSRKLNFDRIVLQLILGIGVEWADSRSLPHLLQLMLLRSKVVNWLRRV